jgi:hypothetical protein
MKKERALGGAFPDRRRLYQVFSREFYWSPAYRFLDRPYEGSNGWQVLHEQGYSRPAVASVMPTAELYQWESRAEFDQLPFYLVPNELIYRRMNLN